MQRTKQMQCLDRQLCCFIEKNTGNKKEEFCESLMSRKQLTSFYRKMALKCEHKQEVKNQRRPVSAVDTHLIWMAEVPAARISQQALLSQVKPAKNPKHLSNEQTEWALFQEVNNLRVEKQNKQIKKQLGSPKVRKSKEGQVEDCVKDYNRMVSRYKDKGNLLETPMLLLERETQFSEVTNNFEIEDNKHSLAALFKQLYLQVGSESMQIKDVIRQINSRLMRSPKNRQNLPQTEQPTNN